MSFSILQYIESLGSLHRSEVASSPRLKQTSQMILGLWNLI